MFYDLISHVCATPPHMWRCLLISSNCVCPVPFCMATKMNCIAQHKNNKRKNDEEDIQTVVNRKKVSLNTQAVRGYDIWRQNQLLMLKDAELEKKKICFKQLGHNWSKLSVAEKGIWNEKALLQRNNLVPLSNEEKKIKSKKLLNQLTKVVEELANLGNEVVAVTCLAQGGPPIVTASEKGCQFLLKSEELNFQFKFSEFVKAPVLNMKKNKVSNATKNNLCIEVTNILNKKYEIARLALPIELQSKFSKGHIPYKKYVPSIIKASGLPDGHVLKYPSSMGSTLLTYIVENQDNIDVIFDLQEAATISNTELIFSVLPNTLLSSTKIDELLPVIKSVFESNTTASTTPNNRSTFELASFSNRAGQITIKSNESSNIEHDYIHLNELSSSEIGNLLKRVKTIQLNKIDSSCIDSKLVEKADIR